LSKKDDLIVFILTGRESQCDECGRELGRGDLLRKEGEKGLCLVCADLDHLEFLPSGDAALTRRSSKHSRLRAVVLQWSRSRKRYERQGILVEPSAIDKAQEECLADEELREARRKRDASKRQEVDREFVKAFADNIRKRYPRCPSGEETRIAEHACRKYSGRVGRTAAAKAFDPEPLELAVRAHLRHAYTNYDELLGLGYERWEARQSVSGDVERILDSWQ
jgi:hypothetical protein